MSKTWIDVTFWLLASPILALRAVARGFRKARFLRLAVRSAVQCECGETVSLVGLWQCNCGFTYKGHLLRKCPVCGTMPVMVRCHACGVTAKLPEAH